MNARYDHNDLSAFAGALFAAAGMPEERAKVVGKLLLEGDLIGQTTHGLALAGGYLQALENGVMKRDGNPEVLSDRGPVALWDGHYLSGVWLVWHGVQQGIERARRYGSYSLVIRRSHHIACLAAFLPLATSQGLMMTLASSDPANQAVAPFGSYQPIYTPNPIAVGYPTDGDPVLIDISASGTTMGLAGRLAAEGKTLPGPWAIDNQGRASDDPNVLNSDPPGGLLPLGGMDRGHKGFALGLMVEALTSGLGGYGRADGADHWGASVYLQLFDPEAFGGGDAFRRETGYLADACRGADVAEGQPPVRLPGDGALARRRAALSTGVELYAGIIEGLTPWAEKYALPLPTPLPTAA